MVNLLNRDSMSALVVLEEAEAAVAVALPIKPSIMFAIHSSLFIVNRAVEIKDLELEKEHS